MAYWLNILVLLALTTIHHAHAAPERLSRRLIHRHSIFPIRQSQDDDIRAPALPHQDEYVSPKMTTLGLIHRHLLSRTGNKLSYCIGNISDPEYKYNQLTLGNGSIIQGNSTPIKLKSYYNVDYLEGDTTYPFKLKNEATFDSGSIFQLPMELKSYRYVVSLEGISIGDTLLIKTNPLEFKNKVIFRSGSMYTRLRKSAYEPLAEHVEMLAQRFSLTRVSITGAERNQLCYKGDLLRELKGFPIVTLNLAGGATLDLGVESLFKRTAYGSAFCMAIVESNMNIIGIMAQQYYNVGFDFAAETVSFQKIDCQLLDE